MVTTFLFKFNSNQLTKSKFNQTMKNRKLILSAMVLMTLVAVVFTSCKKDEDTSFNLVTLLAGTSDLNGATSPADVPTDASIVGTFSTDVDGTTANNSNITMTRVYDGVAIPLNVSTSGATLTIVPASVLGSGTQYELNIGAGLKGTNGTAFVATTRTFTTAGFFVPADAIAYWNFENTADDQIGGLTPSENTDLTYTASRSTAAGQAGTFNGTTSYVDYAGAGPTLMNTASFTLAFWVKTNSVGHVDASGNPKGYFVLGAGVFRGFQFEIPADWTSCKLAASYNLGNGSVGSEDLWFPGNGSTKDNGGWQGWTFCTDLTASGGVPSLIQDKWASIVCTYDAASKVGSMFINGVLEKAQDFNLWPDGDPKQGVTGLLFDPAATDVGTGFVFGFCEDKSSTLFSDQPWGNVNSPDSNHFAGQLDDVAIWHRALSQSEITAMYNSQKP
jgi:hypothetical protein